MGKVAQIIVLHERELSQDELHHFLSAHYAPADETSSPKNTRFDTCLKVVLAEEGGYGNDPDDRGGPTNLGITIGALSAYLGRDATLEEVKALTSDTAKDIYYKNYWLKAECDALPPGIDLMLFNIVVNAGVYRGQELFQTALMKMGVYKGLIDGDIGPETAKALSRVNHADFLTCYDAEIEAFYRKLPKFYKFGNGWLGRLERVKSLAQKTVTLNYKNNPRSNPQSEQKSNPQKALAIRDTSGVKSMTLIDLLIGGNFLKGKKTILGIIFYVALSTGWNMGFIPQEFVSPEMYQTLLTWAIGLAGLGAVSKVVRLARFFGFEVQEPPRKETNFAPFEQR